MSKGVKTVLGIAAAIAVPFVAPAIASTIGLSAAIGSTAGSALVGAGLGAVSSAVTGGDVGRGALMGAIGGGIGGYNYTPAATAAAAPQVGTTGMSALDAGMAQYPSTGVFGGTVSTGAPVLSALDAGMAQYPSTGTFGGPVTTGVTPMAPTLSPLDAGMAQYPSTGTFGGPVATGVTPVEATFAAPTPTAGLTLSEYAAPSVMAPPTTMPVAQPTQAVRPTVAPNINPATGQPYTFTEALSRVPGEIAAKFTDPKTLADLTLRAGGVLAGSALAGDGLSDEEKQLLNAQVEELRRLQQENQALFNQRLSQAQNLVGESKYFDPEYFGLQRARRAQIAGARAKRAGLRGLTGGAREAEARRFDLATGRDVGTAFDTGYQTGVQGRLQTMQAGLSMMPQSYPSSMGDYSNIRQAYESAARRRDETAGRIGDLFGSITGGQQAKKP